ncbi:MAG: aminoacyl-tRNA hydrolase [Myxococcales bacterium]|nr:aminoacyl-tRNA hydrolase [Myxococcales bacterium]MDD9967651.1 aminoacyl-tRNA hydrolase [Myxococcales bacterium]
MQGEVDELGCELVVGLGNPGARYAGNRHNVGFMVVDRLCERHGVGAMRSKFKGEFAKGTVRGRDLLLLKPHTFMNLSGEAVRAAMTFFKLTPTQVLVVHDELDLPFGSVRLKVGGGTAGHNGLKSIQSHCGGPGFMRLRLGIGRPKGGPVQRHVLSDFSSAESTELENVLQSATAVLEDVLEFGIQAAMNRHHGS